MQAVVLAAGRGVRLGSAHPGLPKCLLRIGDTTIIDRMISILAEEQIRPITVVSGYKAHALDHLRTRYEDVQIVHNEHYSHTGTMLSLTVGVRGGSHDDARLLVLNGDITFERHAISALTHHTPDETATVVTDLADRTDEAYVGLRSGLITGISKRRSEIVGEVAELVGITVFSRHALGVMCDAWRTRSDFGPTTNYETVMSAIAPSYPITGVRLNDLVWGEVDDVHQLTRLRTDLYPRIVQSDALRSTDP